MSMKVLVPAVMAFFLLNCGAHAEETWKTIKDAADVYTTGTIQVVGASEESGKRFRSVRKAEVDAREKLFKVVQGIYIFGSTTIQDAILQSDRVRTGVAGYMRGVRKIGEVYYPDLGSAEVAMQVNLRGPGGLYETMIPLIRSQNLKPEKKLMYLPPSVISSPYSSNEAHEAPDSGEAEHESSGHGAMEQSGSGHETGGHEAAHETAAASGHGEDHGEGQGGDDQEPVHQAEEQHAGEHQGTETSAAKPEGHGAGGSGHDGVIVDVSKLRFRPALLNRLMSEKEEVLYDPLRAPNQILAARGGAGYARNVDDAKALLATWGSRNPLVVKGIKIEKFTDIRVSDADAETIYKLDKKANILGRARVVFVLK